MEIDLAVPRKKTFIERAWLPSLLILLALTSWSTRTRSEPTHDFKQWESEIAAFEGSDRANPPAKGGFLFIGSSGIRYWRTLARDFPDHQVLNRGFGGSEIVDATHFADRIIFPYAPRAIFFRAGGNDIHNGKSPEQVFKDFQEFVAKVHEKLPATEILFISLYPTIARWSEVEKTRAVNQLIEQYVHGKPLLKYINTDDMVLGPDGKPRPELFLEDKLHLNREGYKLMAERVRPFLPRQAAQ